MTLSHMNSFVLAQVFWTGGILQFMGVLSITQTTVMVLIQMGMVAIYRKVPLRAVIHVSLAIAPAVLCLVISAQVNSSPTSFLLAELLFFITPSIALLYFVSTNRTTVPPPDRASHAFTAVVVFLAIQLSVVIFQGLFAEYIVLWSNLPLYLLDVRTGTFFISDDHALGAFAVLSILFILRSRSTFEFSTIAAVTIATFLILLTNSRISLLCLPLAILSSVVSAQLRRPVLIFLIGASLLLAVPPIILDWLPEFWTELVSGTLTTGYFRQGLGSALPRHTLLVLILEGNDFSWFGRGPLTYYNYIDRTWLYAGGHSLLYQVWYDLGLIGVITVAFAIWQLVAVAAPDFLGKITIFLLFIVYGSVHNILYDLPTWCSLYLLATLLPKAALLGAGCSPPDIPLFPSPKPSPQPPPHIAA